MAWPLSFVFVGAPNPAEPFDELLQFLVRKLGASFAHVYERDPPAVGGFPRL